MERETWSGEITSLSHRGEREKVVVAVKLSITRLALNISPWRPHLSEERDTWAPHSVAFFA